MQVSEDSKLNLQRARKLLPTTEQAKPKTRLRNDAVSAAWRGIGDLQNPWTVTRFINELSGYDDEFFSVFDMVEGAIIFTQNI